MPTATLETYGQIRELVPSVRSASGVAILGEVPSPLAIRSPGCTTAMVALVVPASTMTVIQSSATIP